MVVAAIKGKTLPGESGILDREKMKIIITGAGGMLGQELVKTLEDRYDIVAFDHKGLDITDRMKLKDVIISERPDIVINCAAYTQVDRAEEDREKAFMVNGLGVQNLALICEQQGVVLCHISTDYVFDGNKGAPYTPFDNTSPVNYYGYTKLAGEQYIKWFMRRFYIVRTSWLYGKNGSNFVKTMIRLSQERDEIRVVKDQIGSPTCTVTLARAIEQIILSEVYGVHHVTDRTERGISWYDFARAILDLTGSKTRPVPITTKEYPTAARRPAYSVLDTSFTEFSTGYNLPDWYDSLKEFIESL